MRALIQRCKKAHVEVGGVVVGQINHGFTVFLGVTHEDTIQDAQVLASKIAGLRIFEDEQGKMNVSISEIEHAAILSVSQFTLYGDCRKGRRPSFTQAAGATHGLAMYEAFNAVLRNSGITVANGQFGADMDVHLVNWGPVTLWIDSKELPGGRPIRGELI